MNCDSCGSPVENGVCTGCGKKFPPNRNMTTCKACGASIAKSAKACPSCGAKQKKSILKRWWFWVLAVLIVVIAVSCGGKKETKQITSTASSETGKSADREISSTAASTSGKDADKEIASAKAAPETATIEQQVLLEHDGVTVTATGYETDSIWGEGVCLLIENSSEKNVGVGCDALIVNNYMISDLFSETVAAGKKSNVTLHLSSSELRAAGIDCVGQIEVYFRLFDSDSYKTLYEADCAVIKTSDFDKMDTTPNDTGKELYNQNGVRIVGKYVDETSFWGAAVLLYIENNTDRTVRVHCDDLSVNGYMVTSLFYSEIYPGKMAIDDIALLSSDLEKNGIESVDDIELVFRITDAETYDTIAETDPIQFSTK